jgi:L,D-transpeptidase ErfK/SrfK
LFFLLGVLGSSSVSAVEYELRGDGGDIFGSVERIRTRYQDTLIELARRYSLGYEELLRVNKGVDPWLPGEGTQVVIPGKRLLPPSVREGIVVNLPEHRMYYFPKPKSDEPARVLTFPVSVGKMDWQTPIGVTKVVSKQKNPPWYPPESVRKEHAARGEPLPTMVPPGPANPLGAHALRLNIPGGSYLIHGTNNPDAVGMAVTHGCRAAVRSRAGRYEGHSDQRAAQDDACGRRGMDRSASAHRRTGSVNNGETRRFRGAPRYLAR